MSADSQRSRLSAGGGGVGSVGGGGGSGSGGGGAVRCMPTIVPPQAVSDRSIIDSVAGFINDVTLQGQTPLGDSKDHILWVRFENAADISDPCLGDDWELEGGIAPPLLLILGYVTGVQVWIVPANGEAIEVLSWRHGSVKCLRVLPTPSAGSERESAAADQTDQYTHKRPLIALCESASVAGGSAGGAAAAAAAAGGSNGGYQYCAVNFVSLKDGETVKSIKFKSTIVDILANRSSIVVTFPERIAVFDARTLEDRLTVTTCHPSPGLNPNPVALGSRWIAYAERRLIASKRSSGGCEGDGVTSYTATVLNAAKSLGKGLRELGEQVAAGLTGSHLGSSLVGGGGGGSGSGSSLGGGFGGGMAGLGGGGGGSSDLLHGGGGLLMGSEGNQQPGVVTVLDIKHPIKDISPTTGTPVTCHGSDPIVAHFLAHSEAIVALAFDAPGMLLLTADRRGHDFHVFRLHPHPSGASLAAVHHLYVLHRGDTTAKVQDISFSLDSRWVAVSTLRGTTHVFPVTPYGGPAGVRTHGSPLVVNRLSRFHRSAGLSIDGRSSSPVSHLAVGEAGSGAHHAPSAAAYANPRTPPFPHPTIVQPLAQLRQPASLAVVGGGGGSGGVGGGGGGGGGAGGSGIGGKGSALGRQRNSSSSSSDDLVKPLRVCATFAKARSWLLDPPGCSVRDTPAHRIQRKPVDSLFIMAAHGALIQYDLEPKHASGTPKEKICDDTPIELEVEAKAQWCLQRQENASTGDIQPPLSLDNWLIKDRFLEDGGGVKLDYGEYHYKSSARELDKQQLPSLGSAVSVDHDERWLSQVEIITHAGPHRRLWMGPQFMFKTYNTPSGSPLSSIDTDAVEICTVGGSGGGGAGGSANLYNRPLQRSNPMNMPLAGGSYEQSPRMMNMNEFRHHENLDTEFSSLGPVESQLREDLADAMRESPLIATGRDTAAGQQQQQQHAVAAHPHQQAAHLTSTSTHHHPLASATGLSSVSSCSSTSIYSSTHSLSSICDHQQQQQQQQQLYHHHQQQQQHCGCKGAPASAAGGGGVGGEGDGAGSYFECKQPAFAGAGDGSGNASALVVSGAPHGASVGGLRGAVGMLTIAKVVNPLGTVTTISGGDGAGGVGGSGGGGGAGGGGGPDSLGSDEFMQECGEPYLHENCDEALFRPVVTVRGGGDVDGGGDGGGAARRYRGSSLDRTGGLTAGGYETRPISQPASLIGRDLIVPVIEEKHLPYFGGTSRVQQAAKEQQQQQQRAKSKPAGGVATTAPADTITIPSAAAAAPVCEEFVNVELPPAGDGEGKEQQKAATRSVARKEKPTGAPKAKKGTAGEKRTGGKQRSSSGKEQQQPATADRGKRVAADEAMVVVVEQVLPPLEALKIDDLELFGEEPDVDGRGQPELVVPASEKHRGFDDPVPVPAPAQSSSSSPPPSPPLPLPPAPLAPLELPDLLEDDDTGGGPPPPEGEDVGGERTLISFESPLQERAPHRLSEQMQGVLARGNILLAMCSSLREASPGVAPTVAPSDEEPSRRGVVAKEPSLEGQDSDYKSLELDSEVPLQQQQQEQEQPASAGVTIVSLHSSASEDDQRCPAAGAQPEPEEENEAETEAEIARSEDGADSSSGSALSKRRRHKRSSSHRTNANVTTTSSSSSSSSTATTMVVSLATADNDANDDDNEDDDNDDADDDDEDDDEEQVDEELQPLISSNKTSSSSLSVTVGHGTAATASEPPVQHDQGPCDDLMLLHAAATGGSELTAITPSRTALPTDSEDGEGGRSGTIASKHDRPTTATTSSTTTTGLPANKSRPAAATLPNAQNASNKPSTIGGGGGGGGGSGGSNGKKKSKKKRK